MDILRGSNKELLRLVTNTIAEITTRLGWE